jgi:4'-phosphopantetheinyl transferase
MPENGVDIDVWFRRTAGLSDAALKDARAVLSASELQRCARLRLPEDRRDYTAAHHLLRTALSRVAPCPPEAWQFDVTAEGKPFIPPDGLPACSLSHTRGLVACAVSAGLLSKARSLGWKVGIDVERIDRRIDVMSIAAGSFSEPERRIVADSPTRFYDIWTLREAFLKAVGSGLSGRVGGMSFEVQGSTIACSLPGVDQRAWHFAVFEPSPDTRMAVAVVGTPVAPRIVARDFGNPSRVVPPRSNSAPWRKEETEVPTEPDGRRA